jgi:copper chaperone CopZ
VRSALAQVDGVESVEVDYGAKTATVTTDGSVDAAQLAAAFEDTRYSAALE